MAQAAIAAPAADKAISAAVSQAATSLPGMPTVDASPYGFALLDRSQAVAGVDTLYVADDRSPALDHLLGALEANGFVPPAPVPAPGGTR